MARPTVCGFLTRWAALLLATTPTALAQDPPPQVGSPAVGTQEPVACRKCKSQGTTPCKKHGKGVLEIEQQLAADGGFCSVAASCTSCAGALALDCPKCDNPVIEASIEARRALVQNLRQRCQQDVNSVVEHDGLLHLRTEHLQLSFSLPGTKVGEGRDARRLDSHLLMHEYGTRIESLRSDFMTQLHLEEKDFSTPLQVFLLAERADHSKTAQTFAGAGAGGIAQKLMGMDAVYSFYLDRTRFRSDPDVHRNVVHCVSHLLLGNMAPAVWIGNRGHGWLDAGVAHWFEDRASGRCTNFCHEEVATAAGLGFANGIWRPAIRALVDGGTATSFAALASKNTDQLTMPEHAVSFAYVDFLLARAGGEVFRDFLRAIKGGTTTAAALREHYKLSPLTIEEPFRAWIQAEYPLR